MNQVAVVTGASRGIGRAIAVELAQCGYRVALLGRDYEKLTETAKLCREAAEKLLTSEINKVDNEEREAKRPRTDDAKAETKFAVFTVDIRDRAAVDAAIDDVVKTFSGISVLVCNAGVLLGTPVVGGDPAKWEEEIDVNVKGTMAVAHAAMPHILQAATCRAVIIIGSTGSMWSWPWGGGYCASKHALRGFAGSLFQEVRDKGVKVCLIMPGFTDTQMVASNPGMIHEKKMRPEDIAHAAKCVLNFPVSACPTEMLIRPQFNCTDGTVPYTIV
eukprot:gnl/MRDRNA2_/MRDRNA2_61697_c0_seq1.p1 gnl/MRDRNA2_/MRDRNA2_61697_c0~~gnl/MRDRNA2_/MRDRNA2_61697_c0_seq1.p1  ORF type:complete len:274 (+),score=51.32 gnl/MRDRNA2_/MRDRNA2_61697_c0_seq1:71-892(+)